MRSFKNAQQPLSTEYISVYEINHTQIKLLDMNQSSVSSKGPPFAKQEWKASGSWFMATNMLTYNHRWSNVNFKQSA